MNTNGHVTGKLLPQEEQQLAAMGLRPVAVLRLPLRQLQMQYRHELMVDHLLLDASGHVDRSIPNSPLYRALQVYQAGGLRAVKRRFRALDYYRMFRAFDAVGYKIDWHRDPTPVPFRWSDRKIWAAKLLPMLRVYESIKRHGYLGGPFGQRYITVLETPFEVSRHNRTFAWQSYEIWGGHHRAAALAALGVEEADVILLRDEGPARPVRPEAERVPATALHRPEPPPAPSPLASWAGRGLRRVWRAAPIDRVVSALPPLRRRAQDVLEAYTDPFHPQEAPRWVLEALYPWMVAECLARERQWDMLPLEERFVTPALRQEFERLLPALQYEPGGLVNTAGLVLYAMIRSYRPKFFVESGTGRGYSTQIIAEALQANRNEPALLTFGLNHEGSLDAARARLARYPFVTVIEGEAQCRIPQALDGLAGRPAAVFIDGPKAKDPAFGPLLAQLYRFNDLLFIAMDDCQQHVLAGLDPAGRFPRGFLNLHRVKLAKLAERFPSGRYELGFMSNAFSERVAHLNDPIYRATGSIRPYWFRNSKQRSHSFEIGAVYRWPR